jgi:hypothetical protein
MTLDRGISLPPSLVAGGFPVPDKDQSQRIKKKLKVFILAFSGYFDRAFQWADGCGTRSAPERTGHVTDSM